MKKVSYSPCYSLNFTHINYVKRIRQFCKLISAFYKPGGIRHVQIYKDNSYDHIKCQSIFLSESNQIGGRADSKHVNNICVLTELPIEIKYME
jgi:hypothetical protein